MTKKETIDPKRELTEIKLMLAVMANTIKKLEEQIDINKSEHDKDAHELFEMKSNRKD